MRLASIHIESVDGLTGPARCYKLYPPFPDPQTGVEYEYVTVCVQMGYRTQQLPEAFVVAANKINGSPVGPSMKRLPGSGVLYFHPETEPEGAYHYVLMQMGVTELREADE